jgi:hypothetical protein
MLTMARRGRLPEAGGGGQALNQATKKGGPLARPFDWIENDYASMTATISSVRGFTTMIWSLTRKNS